MDTLPGTLEKRALIAQIQRQILAENPSLLRIGGSSSRTPLTNVSIDNGVRQAQVAAVDQIRSIIDTFVKK